MASMKCMVCGNLFRVKGNGKFLPPCPHCKGGIKENKKYVKRTANNR